MTSLAIINGGFPTLSLGDDLRKQLSPQTTTRDMVTDLAIGQIRVAGSNRGLNNGIQRLVEGDDALQPLRRTQGAVRLHEVAGG
ncbi:MAG TPA: hypothetical protein VMO47_07410 [Rhodothermales bacterium]|nr:hypothetical protein [Rhodothermales bacterium]